MTASRIATRSSSLSNYSRFRRAPLAAAISLALATGVTPLAQAASGSPAQGAALGHEFQINTTTTGNQKSPTVARNATGDFVVVWEDDSGADGDRDGIFAQRYDANGKAQGVEFQVNTTTVGYQSLPAVALDAAGDFVVVWKDVDGAAKDGAGIFAQRYSANGTAQGSEFRVNTTTTGNQISPVVALDATGDFVVAWADWSGVDGHGVFAQRYDADGITQGSEFRVNTTTTGDQWSPAVALDATGDFVVVWEDRSGAASDDYGVFAQRYDADGITQGSEFRVNTTTTDDQISPVVALDATGDFVVAWKSWSGAARYGVFAQRYSANGTAQGSEFRVNTTTTGDQTFPVVVLDAVGDFVVAWVDRSGADGDGDGIFAQRYSANGTAQGSEFRVNTTTTGDQISPVVALDAAGDFVVAWEDWSGADGDGYGVFAQRYARSTPVDLKTTLVAAPSSVQAGASFTLTASISNEASPSTAAPAKYTKINDAVTVATGLTATIPIPAGVTLDSSTGTGAWACTLTKSASSHLTCHYGAPLAAATATPNVVVSLTAPATAGTLNFQYTAYGDQPDTKTSNNTATANVTVIGSASGGGSSGGSSGGGGGAFGWLGLGLLGLPFARRRSKR